MKIFLYSRQDAVGGTERRMIDLHEYLCEVGINSRIYFSVGKGRQNNKWDNNIFVRLLRLWFKLIIYRPSIVHAFDLESGIYASITTRIFLKTKVVSGFGAEKVTDSRTQKLLKKRWFLADYYICNSEKAATDLKKRLPKLSKIQFILNGLDARRLKKNDSKMQKLIPEKGNKFVIGYIGKLDNIKHGERMIEIAKELYFLNPNGYNFSFVIIGGGPYLENAKEEICSLPTAIKDSITITGQIENAGKLISNFDIGVLCSDSEGLANVLLEYMCLGKPWISTNVGDIYKLNETGETGILIPTFDPKKYAEEIQYLVKNKYKYEELSKTGMQIFKKYYSIEVMGSSYIKIYKTIHGK